MITTQENLAIIDRIVRENRYQPMTHAELADTFKQQTGVGISDSTLRRCKQTLGIRGCVGKKKPERGWYQVNREKRLATVRTRSESGGGRHPRPQNDAKTKELPKNNWVLLTRLRKAAAEYDAKRLHSHVATYRDRLAQIEAREGLASDY